MTSRTSSDFRAPGEGEGNKHPWGEEEFSREAREVYGIQRRPPGDDTREGGTGEGETGLRRHRRTARDHEQHGRREGLLQA